MLEAPIVLELALGKRAEDAIIAGLLIFIAALKLLQEGSTQATRVAIKLQLALSATVWRDRKWTTVPAAGLISSGVVKLF